MQGEHGEIMYPNERSEEGNQKNTEGQTVKSVHDTIYHVKSHFNAALLPNPFRTCYTYYTEPK
jgi:hypothetical protein